MAERMLAYSWLSSRPSQVIQLPWRAEVGEWGPGGHQQGRGDPQRGSGWAEGPPLPGQASLGGQALTSPQEHHDLSRKSRKLLARAFKNTFPTRRDPECPFFPRVRGAESLRPGLAHPLAWQSQHPGPTVLPPRAGHSRSGTHQGQPGAAWAGGGGGRDCRQAGHRQGSAPGCVPVSRVHVRVTSDSYSKYAGSPAHLQHPRPSCGPVARPGPAPDSQAGILPRTKEAGPPAEPACCALGPHASDAGRQQRPWGPLLLGGQATARGWHRGSVPGEPPRLKRQQMSPPILGGLAEVPGFTSSKTELTQHVCGGGSVHTYTRASVYMSLGLGCLHRLRNMCICDDNSWGG